MEAPLYLQIELTNACNHRCEYCYNYDRLKKDYFTRELVDKVLDIFEDRVFEITLTGGEPLLNKSVLFYILEKCENKNIDTYLNTNLTLLKTEDLDKLKYLRGILASFPSCDEDLYNKITNSKNYKKFLSNLEKVKNDVPIGINMTVTQSNKKEVYSTGEFIYSQDIEYFSATPIVSTSKKQKGLGLSKSEVIKMIEDLVELHETYGIEVDSLESIPNCLLPKEYREKYRFSSRACSAGDTNIAIDPIGNVRPCPVIELNVGNILKNEFKTILDNLLTWRECFNKVVECEGCGYIATCGKGCRARAYYTYGAYDAKDPLCVGPVERETELTVFNPDRLYHKKEVVFREEKEDIFSIKERGRENIVFGNESLVEFIQKLPQQIDCKKLTKKSKRLIEYLYINNLLE
jgi:radical SAM protein with 4Fe4S-binding SPASM domain